MRGATAAAAILTVLLIFPVAEAADAVVVIKDNYYDPSEIRIEPGESVTWVNGGNQGHTVTDYSGTFDSGTLELGQSFTHRFDAGGTYRYACRRHGDSMSGTVQVGDLPPSQTPPPISGIWVPSEVPTLDEALSLASENTTINIEPGTHRVDAPPRVKRANITIRGAARDRLVGPDEVVLISGGAHSGLEVKADDVTIHNLTFKGFEVGIELDGADGFELNQVVLRSNTIRGVGITDSRGGVLTDVSVIESQTGLYVDGCRPCDLLIIGARLKDNFVGVDVRSSSQVLLRGSHIEANAVGVLALSPMGNTVEQAGLVVYDNQIAETGGGSPPSIFAADRTQYAGAGSAIWIAGGAQNMVANNRISSTRYGIAVTMWGRPPMYNRIFGNDYSSSTVKAVAWDGTGAGNCFSPSPIRPPVTTGVEELLGCEQSSALRVLEPAVTAHLMAEGLRRYDSSSA